MGETFYLAPNPPFGAVLTYYLEDSIRAGAEARRENEKALDKEGKPVPFPGWDKLRREEAGDKPLVILTVTDEAGQVVRRITGPVTAGIHRIAWDLRYPAVEPVELEPREQEEWEWSPQGPLVVPGKFTVSMAKKVDGVATQLGQPRTFTVESLGLASLAEKDKEALLQFQKKAGELQRAMMGAAAAAEEALKNIPFMKKALLDTRKADPKLGERAKEIELRLREALQELWGDRTILRRSEPSAPGLRQRVSAQLATTCPITET